MSSSESFLNNPFLINPISPQYSIRVDNCASSDDVKNLHAKLDSILSLLKPVLPSEKSDGKENTPIIQGDYDFILKKIKEIKDRQESLEKKFGDLKITFNKWFDAQYQ